MASLRRHRHYPVCARLVCRATGGVCRGFPGIRGGGVRNCRTVRRSFRGAGTGLRLRLVPAVAGCSLAESITVKDVKDLRKKYPEASVVCYVNTTAAVKAQCDACCTSSNALKIIEGLPQKKIIFLPDEFMAKNLQPMTKKRIIGWNGRCIVHEEFSPKTIDAMRKNNPGIKILAHLECTPAVIEKSDMAGGTEGMIRYVKSHKAKSFMLVTECGLTDRMKIELPNKKMVGTCVLCPYMKKITLKNIFQALQSPEKDQIINLPPDVLKKAGKALNRMIRITEGKRFK